ncbi:MAG: fatty-acid synthase [Thiothrix sp.]|nr:MAG: fatty-acid synthase [Thiothrix sp.]
MPQKDESHLIVKEALVKDGWEITDDPYVISYGERFLFVDLAASSLTKGQFIGAQRKDQLIAVEIKEFRGKSAVNDLEQAIGQYVLYQLLLRQVDPKRRVYLAISDIVYDEIFSEPIGELVINELPMDLIVINVQAKEVIKWIKKTTSKR